MKVDRLLEKHNKLLQYLDKWSRSIQTRYAGQMQCRRGCVWCCHGLFDISLPDAVRLAKAYESLSGDVQNKVAILASDIQRRICEEDNGLVEPYFLHEVSPERIDRIVDRIPDVCCPLLSEHDSCLLYNHRPLACRLEGIPMVDTRDGLFDDWCELNFKEGVFPELAGDLSLDYYEIQAIELETTGNLSEILLAARRETVTVFVPSVIAAFENFWKSHVRE